MAEKEFLLQVVSPDRVFYEGSVSMVELVTSEGEIGVLAGHIPMTNILKPQVSILWRLMGNAMQPFMKVL